MFSSVPMIPMSRTWNVTHFSAFGRSGVEELELCSKCLALGRHVYVAIGLSSTGLSNETVTRCRNNHLLACQH
eukprot:5245573-Pyramimonas_sp.AAC.1